MSPKYMKYICCENERDYKRWMAGIRLVKFGRQLYDNYKKMIELEEMSKISGFLLLANNRRTSANLSNSQRPKSNISNYSVNSVLLERSNSVASNMTQPSRLSQQQPQTPKQKMSESLFVENKQNDYSADDNSNSDTIRSNFTLDETVNFRVNLSSKFLQQNQLHAPIKTNNEASSLLNMLKPARRSQSSVSSLTNTFSSSLQKQAKLPVNTGITMQMLTSNESNTQQMKVEDASALESKHDFEQETHHKQVLVPRFLNSSQEANPISSMVVKSPTRSLPSTDSNQFDFPSPPAELLEPFPEQQFLQQNSPLPSPPAIPSEINIFPSRLSKGPAPVIAPKPTLQSVNLNRSLSNCSSYRQNFDSLNLTDSYYRGASNNSISLSKPLSSLLNANNNSNPQLLDELSAKLARQRKLIEVDEPNKHETDGSIKNARTSPKLQKKPPPPPRSDSIRVSNSSFIRAGNYN